MDNKCQVSSASFVFFYLQFGWILKGGRKKILVLNKNLITSRQWSSSVYPTSQDITGITFTNYVESSVQCTTFGFVATLSVDFLAYKFDGYPSWVPCNFCRLQKTKKSHHPSADLRQGGKCINFCCHKVQNWDIYSPYTHVIYSRNKS